MSVSILSATFVWKISHFKKKLAKYDKKFILVFIKSAIYYCPMLMKLEFFSTDIRKVLKYQISWKSVQ